MSLTPEQIDELRTQLRTERIRILANIEALHADFEELKHGSPSENGLETHIGDQGTNTFLRERDLSLGEHETYLLDEIDAALARIDAGSFGVCEVDGTPIEFERLQALPWARTHVEHATT